VTASLASELRKRATQRLPDRPTFADDLARLLTLAKIDDDRLIFPDPLYRDDPAGFFRRVLGVEPWERQIEILEAVRDHPRVAIASGHKIGKSACAAGIALWYFASWPDARVVMSSTTARQVDQILWREIRMMRARSGRCLDCKAADPDGLVIPVPCPHSAILDGDQGELARTGLKSRTDFREIVGFTAREAEAVAGISGRNLLYIIDEASGVPDVIFTAIEGNRAGGAKIVLFGNPTRNEGEFFDAFYGKSKLYHTLRVSSEETPNVVNRDVRVPGLATWEWIQEKREEWGIDSPMYAVRIKGEHALAEEGKIFSLHMIELAEQRHAETPEAGRLFLGVDPAGESGTGDEAAFVARRGIRQVAMQTRLGLTPIEHLHHAITMLATLRVPRETPVIVVDREGQIGHDVYLAMRDYQNAHPEAFELVAVRAADKAHRQPHIYDRMRDELAANLEAWFRDGGAILEDTRLERDLHVLQWKYAANGKLKLIAKDLIRKMLGRSPDRYDALALAAWEPLSLRDDDAAAALGAAAAQMAMLAESAGHPPDAARVFDPYAARDVWRK